MVAIDNKPGSVNGVRVSGDGEQSASRSVTLGHVARSPVDRR